MGVARKKKDVGVYQNSCVDEGRWVSVVGEEPLDAANIPQRIQRLLQQWSPHTLTRRCFWGKQTNAGQLAISVYEKRMGGLVFKNPVAALLAVMLFQ